MKKLVLAVALCCTFGVSSTFADFWGNIGRAVGKAWEDVKRETTNAAHNTEQTVSKAWEDTKREASTKEAKIVGAVVIAAADVALGDPAGAINVIKDIARVI